MCTSGVRVYPQCPPETALIFFTSSQMMLEQVVGALFIVILDACLVGIYPQTSLESEQDGAGWRQ